MKRSVIRPVVTNAHCTSAPIRTAIVPVIVSFMMIFAAPMFVMTPLHSHPTRKEADTSDTIYGNIDPTEYVTGQFAPNRHADFATAAAYGIPDHGRGIYLRRETLEALKKMYAQMKIDLVGVPFWIQSGTRNFASQKAIWESKWNGNVAVGGIRLNTINDPLQRARRILSYSSMPGTSRHHWGTDFDINSLTVDYYRSGEGKKLYDWMLHNAPRYGFCLVYTEGRSEGYQFEPWHWSYRPLSSVLLKDWERLYREKKIKGDDVKFAGSGKAFSLAPVYVGAVNQECRTTGL